MICSSLNLLRFIRSSLSDVGLYQNLEEIQGLRSLAEDDFILGANANGRDNSQTPMQWSAAPNAGFTTGTPWIEVNPNYERINVAAAEADPDSILAHYRRLIALRTELPVIVEGRYTPWLNDHPHVMAYTRTLGGRSLLVTANFSSALVTFDVPEPLQGEWDTVLGPTRSGILDFQKSLGPFEANVWMREGD